MGSLERRRDFPQSYALTVRLLHVIVYVMVRITTLNRSKVNITCLPIHNLS